MKIFQSTKEDTQEYPTHRVAWFSGGATSALACKLSLEADPTTTVVTMEIGSHHPDHERFLRDCEEWFGVTILRLRSAKYSDHFEVIEKTRYINGPSGARCTTELKKNVRKLFERSEMECGHPITHYVWGFESGKKEEGRAKKIIQATPGFTHEFPLIAAGLDKRDALKALQDAGIRIPDMYVLGYSNNNCVGCVKGGMAYWNKIRIDFPEIFERMAKLERSLGHSCLRKCFLDELDPVAGRGTPPLVSDCGSVGEGCEIELSRLYNNRE